MHADPPMSLPFPRDPEALAPPGPGHPVDALRTAITYGTFDLFHIGHVRLLQRIKERFDFVIVAVSTDEFNALKGKKSVMSFEERMEVVKACRWVDLVIAETGWDQKERDIMVYGVDAVVMGDDWTGRFDDLQSLCGVSYLPRTENISSTQLKTQIAQTTQMAKMAVDPRAAEVLHQAAPAADRGCEPGPLGPLGEHLPTGVFSLVGLCLQHLGHHAQAEVWMHDSLSDGSVAPGSALVPDAGVMLPGGSMAHHPVTPVGGAAGASFPLEPFG